MRVPEPTHNCEAAGCDRVISTRYLMCLQHWRLVPADVAREVNRTWAGYVYCRAPFAHSALRRYQAAVKAAVAAVASYPSSTTTTGKDCA